MNDSADKEIDSFNRLLAELRPKLHRYCARMTGSVIDGEDVVQEALGKAIEAYAGTAEIANPEGWLFRIAHNAALDHLRRRARQDAAQSDEDPEMIADPRSTARDPELVATSLRTFMRLPVAQRSSVILMDVLGYSLDEIGGVLDATIPAVKAALHRGRERLRELAREPDDRPPPVLSESERSLLKRYVDRFNAHDFDAIRSMLADEVRLDLVSRKRMKGYAEVANYFHNYDRISDWHLVQGLVEGRPAVLVHDPADPSATPRYIILVDWAGGRISAIRDFRYARYVLDGAEISPDRPR
jgi:RNA polymerase sigma-70 factor (ECF subfamily)